MNLTTKKKKRNEIENQAKQHDILSLFTKAFKTLTNCVNPFRSEINNCKQMHPSRASKKKNNL